MSIRKCHASWKSPQTVIAHSHSKKEHSKRFQMPLNEVWRAFSVAQLEKGLNPAKS